MAYLVPDEEDRQQAAQPLAPGNAGGGGFSGGGTGYTGPAQRNAQTPQQQSGSGTGFTNLSSWLNAGSGRSQGITSTGSKVLGQETSDFTKAAQPLMDATYNPLTATDSQVHDSLYLGAGVDPNAGFGNQGNTSSGSGYVSPDQAAGTAPTPHMVDLSALVNQKYTGPGPMSYDLTSSNPWLNQAGQLGSADTAGALLAKNAGNASYGSGDRRMDSILFGADSASQKAMQGVTNQTKQITGLQGQEMGALNDKVAGFSKAADAASKHARDQLGGIGGILLSNLNSRVGADNTRDANGKLAAGANTSLPGATSPTMPQWQDGTGATQGNVVDAGESQVFQRLKSLLGDNKYDITKNGTYAPGHLVDVANPDYVPPDKRNMQPNRYGHGGGW